MDGGLFVSLRCVSAKNKAAKSITFLLAVVNYIRSVSEPPLFQVVLASVNDMGC